MRRNRLIFATLATVGAATLVLSGCSSNTEPNDEDHPLTPYFTAIYAGQDMTQEDYDKQHADEQALIAECMVKQGFEYKPDTNGGVIVYEEEDTEEDSGPEWGTLEFAKEYGYGIVDWPGMNDMPTPSEDEGEEYFDPNEDYVMSLSESEQQAYYEALSGPGPTDEQMELIEEGGDFDWDSLDQGCYGEAQKETQNNPAMDLYEDPEFTDLMQDIENLYNDMQDDERIKKLNGDWAECMAKEGLSDYSDRNLAQESLQEEWNEKTEELNANNGENDEWKEPSQDVKDEFQKREIEVAVADFTCADKLKWDKINSDVDIDLSQAFVDKNKAQLDAMVAKYGQKK
ncbi:hypothetical protein [Leucobacter chinensis]|uniref:hypothetical protein n=1 Tax=Leucobacter chinensis TaxID=2851010 RepID=UPI001C237E43|nr:hypothetical protein [Leucobacter chinensis]